MPGGLGSKPSVFSVCRPASIIVRAFGREVMAAIHQPVPDDYAVLVRVKREAEHEVPWVWRRIRGSFR